MRSNLKYLLLLVAMLTIGIGLGALMVKYHVAKLHGRVTVRCDTVVRVDTIFVDKPVVKDSIVTRYVTRYLPAVKNKVQTEVYTSANEENHDSVNVILPIEQKTYTSDQYTAWVSGYEPRLDSIALYKKEVVVEKEIYLDKKRRRWGCVVGAGVGTNNTGVSPYVGITVGYILF